MTRARQFGFIFLGIGTIVWFAVGGEALSRFEGNWRLDMLTLTKRPTIQHIPDIHVTSANSERAMLAQITYQRGIDLEWFFIPPARLNSPRSAELQARTNTNPAEEGQENFIWNDALLAHPDPAFVAIIHRQKVDTIFAFHSYDGTAFPRYRLYPGNDFAPTPWVTNRWGWLGTDTGVRKPPHTIRVGIIGDSTSHNLYALNLQSFLEAWGKQNAIGVRFEVFSIGRQGLGYDDELVALKYELGPMGLDYIYEYFVPGFSLNLAQVVAFAKFPYGVVAGKPPSPSHRIANALRPLLAPLLPFSALVRLSPQQPTSTLLTEPQKPRVKIRLPTGSGGRIVLAQARKAPYFGDLIKHLDAFKATAETLKATPLVSTERICAWDRMVLRSDTNYRLYQVLNGKLFWPYSYGDVRQMLGTQNGVIKAWAQANDVTVVDIDGRIPPQPELCEDPWHDRDLGHRMRAWLIFQAIVPHLVHDIRTGTVPRTNGIDSDVHPYLDQPIERINREKWLAQFDSKPKPNHDATH